jgi:hypothetical protein
MGQGLCSLKMLFVKICVRPSVIWWCNRHTFLVEWLTVTGSNLRPEAGYLT